MSRLTKSEVQKGRAEYFPKDRIPFLKESAFEDMKVFTGYIEGRLNVETCLERIARNNFLPQVTEEQFFNELVITGWLRP